MYCIGVGTGGRRNYIDHCHLHLWIKTDHHEKWETGRWSFLHLFKTQFFYITYEEIVFELTSMERGGSIIVNNGNSFLYIPSAWQQEQKYVNIWEL